MTNTKTRPQSKGFYKEYLKRLLDVIFSFSAIIILSPLMLLVALLIRVKLGSPVLFKQERPGRNEDIFTLLKFRTMTESLDEAGRPLPDQQRLTKIGRILRSTSLDELPELFNILRGDMSFVGPRPLSVKYLPYYNDVERKRHDVRPGLTGLAQVNGRNTIDWETRFQYDIDYINSISLLLDIKVILRTFVQVVKRSDIGQGVDRPESFSKYRIKQRSEVQ